MDVFLISKPLQFMVSAALSEGSQIKGLLLIVDSFYGAEEFSKKKELLNYFNKVVYFKHTREALISLVGNKSISRIYIDSDYGIQKGVMLFVIKMFNRKVEINVYEEGNGVYRSDLINGRLKKIVYKFLPLSGSLGGSPLTENIYVVDKKRYDNIRSELSHKSVYIGKDFPLWIKENIEGLTSLFGDLAIEKGCSSDICVLYITSWTIDNNVIDYLLSKKQRFIIKPHPHIKHLNIDQSIDVISPGIPVEVILIKLLDSFEHIHVYHAGTSALDYVNNLRIKSFDIREL